MESLEQMERFFDEHEIEGTAYFTDPSYVTAIIGLTDDECLVYDYYKMIDFLVETDGMGYTDASDFFTLTQSVQSRTWVTNPPWL